MKTLLSILLITMMAFPLIILLLPVEVKAEMTANQALHKYDKGTRDEQQLLEWGLAQTENGLSWANTYLKVNRKEQPLYCPPDKMVLTGNQILDILRRAKDDQPYPGGTTVGESPFGLAMIFALQSTFPCPPKP
jgi:hypothetical protein